MKNFIWKSLFITILVGFMFLGFAYGEEDIPPEEDVLEWMEMNAPLLFAELEVLQQENQDLFEEKISNFRDTLDDLQELKINSPDMFKLLMKAEKLEIESLKISEQLVETQNKEENQSLEPKLKDVLGKIFDIRQEGIRFHIKMLEKDIAKTKILVEKRDKNKSQIIKLRMDDLLKPDQDESLNWL